MNQLTHPSTGLPAAPLPATMVIDQEEEGAGVNLLAVAWAGRWLLALCTLVGGGLAWAYLQQTVPRYTSVARIYVEQNMPRLLSSDAMGGFSNKYLFTQAELIRSTAVLGAAVESPEIASLSTMRSLDNPVALLREKLTVSVGERDDIINIALELEDAEEAAQIVNAVVDAYITKYAEERRTDVVEVVKILRSEKQRRDDELEQRRKDLETYRSQHVTLAIESKEGNVVNELFSALSGELNTTQIELLEAKTKFARAQKMLENPDQIPYLMELARSGQVTTRGAELDAQIQAVEQNLVTQESKWGDGYPAVRLLKDSLEKLRERQDKQQEAMLKAYLDTLRQNYELLVQRRDELQKAYDKQFELATQVSQQTAKLADLQDAYEKTAEYCDTLNQQIREVNLNEEVGAMNVSVLEFAAAGAQTYPDRPKTLSVGLAFGAMAGFGLAWLRDLLDQRLKSVDAIASTLQLPVIGALPLLAASRGGPMERTLGGRVTALEPRSTAAEAVRSLRTTLHFGVGEGAKVFVVTSPAPGDGKSTVASNLAIAMAQANQRVLLIDADMRKPTQHEIFGVSVDQGFAAVLSGVTPAVEAIIPSGVPMLDLLPVGKKPGNPLALLNNGTFREVISHLSQHYDQILIDSPPVMPVADSRVISAMADCTLLVLRADRSTRKMSVGARDELIKVRTQRLGVVVNAAPLHRSGYGYGYGYGAYGAYGQAAYGDEPESNRGSRKRLKASRDVELTAVDG